MTAAVAAGNLSGPGSGGFEPGSLAALLDRAACMLKAEGMGKDGRIAIIVMLESLLHEAGAYTGFMFTDGADGRTDDTRRRYYYDGNG